MIRTLVILLVMIALATAGAWLAEHPGEVTLFWQGWKIETSLLTATAFVVLVTAVLIGIWSLLRFILRMPAILGVVMRHRRREQGWAALSQGLVALAAGDVPAAKRHAKIAHRYAGHDTLALLLEAQTAQQSGDRAAMDRAFHLMLEASETRLLGLRGLYVDATRRGEHEEAFDLAGRAAKYAPALPWAAEAILEYYCRTGNFDQARKTLDREVRSGAIEASRYKRLSAVLMAAQAQQLQECNPDKARNLALEALKLVPDLVPAAAMAADLLREQRDTKRAARLIQQTWKLFPHPALSEVYLRLYAGSSAKELLKAVETLVEGKEDHQESQLIMGLAALKVQDYQKARHGVAPLLDRPTRRAALLMAAIEQAERGDTPPAREWMTRATHALPDPAWMADGITSEIWQPMSPHTGRLDAFEWTTPTILLPSAHRDQIEVSLIEAVTPAPEPEGEEKSIIPFPPAPDDPGPDQGTRPAASPLL